MNWYKKAKNEIDINPLLQESGIVIDGTDLEEVIKTLAGEQNNKYFIQKQNDNSSYYYGIENDKLVKFLSLAVNQFPNVVANKYWQQQANGDYQEGYWMTQKGALNDLLNAQKVKTTEGIGEQYHQTMGKMYGYSPEEIQQWIKENPSEPLKETTKPFLIIQDIQTNQKQQIV